MIPKLSTALAALAMIPSLAAQDATAFNLARNLPAQKARALARVHAEVDNSAMFGGAPIQLPAEMMTSVIDTTAVCVDATGLFVTSLSVLQPASMIVEVGGMFGGGGNGEDEDTIPEFEELDLLLADGTRVPAVVVVADRDLDLAVLAPREALADEVQKRLHAQDVEGAKPSSLQPLDRLFGLERLPASLGGGTAITPLTITAVATDPALYVVEGAAAGRPVFTATGEFVGVGSTITTVDGGMSGMPDMRPVVRAVPAIAQALAAARKELAKAPDAGR